MGNITRGERVGGYELVRVLGEGGMGTVWLARNIENPAELVAVKTVSPQYAADPRVCEMFLKEATLAAAIEHPNVVHLYDVGLHDGVPFFVMEWIEGYSLREVARAVAETGERVPAGVALRIASDLCGGLHAAHELATDDGVPLNLVHRDVSPHNVLVTRDGVPKLIDFGVAKAIDIVTGSDQSVVSGLKGKVRYMAPEQALEKAVDRRADLFSVGAIVYALLTGRAPFEGPNELAVINSLLSTQPVHLPSHLPEPVQWILRRALSRKPEQRFATAAEMQGAIEQALSELGEPSDHATVVECLEWFAPPEEDEEPTTAQHREDIEDALPHALGSRHPPAPPPHSHHPSGPPHSHRPSSPPPHAISAPPMAIPARRSLTPDDRDVLVPHANRALTAASWRFVLLGAGFVGLLGLGAAMLVKDGPRRPDPATAAALDNAPLPAATPAPPPSSTNRILMPSGASPNTPIIDMGDVDDQKKSSPPKPKSVRKAPLAPSGLPTNRR